MVHWLLYKTQDTIEEPEIALVLSKAQSLEAQPTTDAKYDAEVHQLAGEEELKEDINANLAGTMDQINVSVIAAKFW